VSTEPRHKRMSAVSEPSASRRIPTVPMSPGVHEVSISDTASAASQSSGLPLMRVTVQRQQMLEPESCPTCDTRVMVALWIVSAGLGPTLALCAA